MSECALGRPKKTRAPLTVGLGPDAESGRGMALLDALAVRWGVEVVDGGTAKTVWCELTS